MKKEIDLSSRVQILDEVVYISLHTLEQGRKPSVPALAMCTKSRTDWAHWP